MKVLAFAATSSRQSINAHLVRHAVARLRDEHLAEVEVEFLDLNDFEMPIYSIDRERGGGIPKAAQRFFDHIGSADGLIVSYAEHNGFYTSAFKNIFDWASRIDQKVFQNKPKLALSTSPGGGGGGNVLKTAIASAPHFAADIVGSLSVPRFRDNFDTESATLTNGDLSSALTEELRRFSERLKAGR